MKNAKRNWDLISEEKRKTSIQAIIDFFQSERSEEIGVIAAEEILDFLLQEIGRDLYNQGVRDTKSLVKSRVEDLELDMEELMKV